MIQIAILPLSSIYSEVYNTITFQKTEVLYMNKISFKNIVGYDNEKQELLDISRILKSGEELSKMGATLPKGLFLVGPNGVGKTLLAKAFIADTKITCVEIKYNEIKSEETFSSYIHEKFMYAKEHKPCIIFADEIDKILGSDINGNPGSNEERVKIFLNEVNDFNKYSDIYLVLVGNEDRELDSSLTRSGRIDRTIKIDYPNQLEREELFKFYLSKTKCNKSVNPKKLARTFSNISCADIKVAVNNAITKAFLKGKAEVDNDLLMNAVYDITFKDVYKKEEVNDDMFHTILLHEAGHALAGIVLGKVPATVAVKSRGTSSGSNIFPNNNYFFIDAVINDTVILLAGRAAEMLYGMPQSTGSSTDIKMAMNNITKLIRFEGYKGLEYIIPAYKGNFCERIISNEKLREMEEKETELLLECYERAKVILRENKGYLDKIVALLEEKQIIDEQDIINALDEGRDRGNVCAKMTAAIEMTHRCRQITVWKLYQNLDITYSLAKTIFIRLHKNEHISSIGYGLIGGKYYA